jgi:hypothetical protein
MNRENLSEFVHFISNHCYINSTIKSYVQAQCFVLKCFYGNGREVFVTDGHLLPLIKKKLLHSLGLVYKSMRGMMTNSIDRDQWLNVTSESRDRI